MEDLPYCIYTTLTRVQLSDHSSVSNLLFLTGTLGSKNGGIAFPLDFLHLNLLGITPGKEEVLSSSTG